MRVKPSLEILPPQTAKLPVRTSVAPAMPPQVMTVPGSFPVPATTWGARRQTKYYLELTGLANAQSGYLRARGELAKSFVAAARAVNEVAELPEICHNDTQVRRAGRERDYLSARREVEEAKYGLYATLNEVDKLRRPRLKKTIQHHAAIDALMKTKVDKEALGEDTGQIDQALAELQRD